MIIGTAFVQQIFALLKDRSGAVSTSISSWLIFTVVSTISLTYGLGKLHDTLFIFCSTIAVIGNGAILCLSIYRRWQTKTTSTSRHSATGFPRRA